jgi:hypothetical protein
MPHIKYRNEEYIEREGWNFIEALHLFTL